MKRTLATLLIAAAIASAAGTALACSCRPYSSAAEQLESAALAIKARALETKATQDGWLATRFEVIDVLKGDKASHYVIEHRQPTGANCGIAFAPGETALVFAGKQDRGFTTSECARARFSEGAYRAVLGLN
jgi:hypothetical protein